MIHYLCTLTYKQAISNSICKAKSLVTFTVHTSVTLYFHRSKELEMQLLQACKEDLLKLDEEDENEEEELSHEQRYVFVGVYTRY